MRVVSRHQGKETTHEIPPEVSVLVAQPTIKVTCPDAYLISAETTAKTMREMSQRAWEHISTGELFKHLYGILFKGDTYIPKTIEEMLEEDAACIHGAGLIIQLVETRFNGVKQVHIDKPEANMHPQQAQALMSVVEEIKKIPLGGDVNV